MLTLFASVCRSKRERFLQFSWRPRPDTLLTADQEAQIAKEFKRYSKKYQEEDELIHTQVSHSKGYDNANIS